VRFCLVFGFLDFGVVCGYYTPYLPVTSGFCGAGKVVLNLYHARFRNECSVLVFCSETTSFALKYVRNDETMTSRTVASLTATYRLKLASR
jgi:hypothetical protein